METYRISVDAEKKHCLVEVKTSFRLYRNDPQSFEMLAKLAARIFRETKLEPNLSLLSDKTLHLSSRQKLSKKALLRKVEIATAIIKEIYGIPNAPVKFSKDFFRRTTCTFLQE